MYQNQGGTSRNSEVLFLERLLSAMLFEDIWINACCINNVIVLTQIHMFISNVDLFFVGECYVKS